MAGDGDDRQVFGIEAALHAGDEFDAAHLRHLEVGHQHRIEAGRERIERLQAVARRHDDEAGALEQPAQLGACDGRVVDQQQGRHFRRRRDGVLRHRQRRRRRLRRQRRLGRRPRFLAAARVAAAIEHQRGHHDQQRRADQQREQVLVRRLAQQRQDRVDRQQVGAHLDLMLAGGSPGRRTGPPGRCGMPLHREAKARPAVRQRLAAPAPGKGGGS